MSGKSQRKFQGVETPAQRPTHHGQAEQSNQAEIRRMQRGCPESAPQTPTLSAYQRSSRRQSQRSIKDVERAQARSTPWGAFWGSISDSTGYTAYCDGLEQAANQLRPGGNVVMDVGRIMGESLDQSTGYHKYRDSFEQGALNSDGSVMGIVTGGVKQGYMDHVYQPQYEQTSRDYALAQKYGSETPGYDAVAISMGRHIGTTSAAEAAYGWDTNEDRALNTQERILKGSDSTSKLAGNAAIVAGMMPSLRHMPIRNPLASKATGRAAYNRAGVANPANPRAANTVREAVPPNMVDDTLAAFGDDVAEKTVGPMGRTVYRYSGGESKAASRWSTSRPVADPRSHLALPNHNTAQKVSEHTLHPGTRYLEGSVSSQVNNPLCVKGSPGQPFFGQHATGGGNQMMILGDNAAAKAAYGRSGYTPLLTIGGGVIANTPRGSK